MRAGRAMLAIIATLALACAGPAQGSQDSQDAQGGQDAQRAQEGLTGRDVLAQADRALAALGAFEVAVAVEGVAAGAPLTPQAQAVLVRGRAQGDGQDAAAPMAVLGVLPGAQASTKTSTGASAQAGANATPIALALDAGGARALHASAGELRVATADNARALLVQAPGREAIGWLARWGQLVRGPFLGDAAHAAAAPLLVARVLVEGEPCHAVYTDLSDVPGAPEFAAWWYVGVEDGLPRRLELVSFDLRDDQNRAIGDGVVRVSLRGWRRLEGPPADDRADGAVDDASPAPASTGVLEALRSAASGAGLDAAAVVPADAPFALRPPPGMTRTDYQPPRLAGDPRRSGGGGGAASGESGLPRPAPSFSLQDPEGKTHSLDDYAGRVVVLDFWATWCSPCEAVMPQIQEVHERYKDRGVAVFGVNAWETGDPAQFMANRQLTYGLLLEGDRVAADYGVTGIPTMVVIDPAGRIVFREVGASTTLADRLSKAIDQALAGGGGP